MPNNFKTQVDLIIQGINRTDGASKDALKNIGLIGIGANAAIAPVLALSDALINAEKQALQLALAIGKESVLAFANFQDARINASKFIDDAELDDFIAEVKELSLEFGLSATESLEAAVDWVKAGKTGEEAFKLFTLSLQATVAGEVELASSTEALRRITESFGFDADTTRGKLDFLNNVADNSATTFGGLLDALGPVSGVAAEFGISFERIVTLLNEGSARTQEYNEVGTAFKSLIVTLARPTKEQADQLIALGLAQDEAGLAQLTTAERFERFLPIVANLTGVQKEYSLSLIAGKEQVNRIASATAGLSQANEFLANNFAKVNTLSDEASRQQEKLVLKFQQVEQVLIRIRAAIGSQFEEGVFAVSDELVKLGTILSEELGGTRFEGVFSVIEGELFNLSDAIATIRENLPKALEGVDTTKLEKSLENLVNAVKNVFDIDLTSPEGLKDVIQLLSDAFANLNNFAVGWIESKEPLVNGAIAIAEAFAGLDEETAKAFGGLSGYLELFDNFIPDVDTILIALIALKTGILGSGAAATAAAGAIATYGGGVVAAGGLAANAVFQAKELGNAIALIGGEGRLPFVVTLLENLGLVDLSDLDLQLLARDLEKISETDPDEFLTDLNEDIAAFTGVTDSAEEALRKFADTNLEAEQSFIKASDGVKQLDDRLSGISDSAKTSLFEFEDALAGVGDAAEAQNKKFVGLGTSTNEAFFSLSKLQDVTGAVGVAFDNNLDRYVKVTAETLKTEKGTRELISTYKDAEGNVIRVYESIGESAKKNLGDKAADATDKALEKTKEFQLKLLEIASDERIAKIEASVELNIAQLENDTRRIEAAFESINTSIESTGSTITDAFGLLADVNPLDRLDLLQFIKDENARRAQAFDQQRQLVDAQIDVLQAQASRLRSKDPWFQIDGSGLQTELRALMQAVLRFTQVNMIASNADFLVGVNPFIAPSTP